MTFASSIGLFAILVLDHSRSLREITTAMAAIDTLRHRVQVDRASRDSMLSPGDRLPDVSVLKANGDPESLADLVHSRPRFVYFSRDDCLPCQQLDAVLATLAPSAKSQILILSTHPEDAAGFRAGIEHIRLARRGSLGTRVPGVPTLAYVSSDGLTLSVVHASFIRTMRMMAAFGLAPPAVIDSAIARALPNLRRDTGTETTGASVPDTDPKR